MMAQMGPDELFMDFAEGKQSAFDAIFKKYFNRLKYFAYTLTQNMHEAEDIVMATFGKVHTKRGDFNKEENLKAFLYISVRNACIDFLKSKNRQSKNQTEYAYLNTPTVGIDRGEIESQVLELLQSAIEALPPKRKQVFKLLYFNELKSSEVAEKLQISIKVVQKAHRLAIEDIKASIQKSLVVNVLLLLLFICSVF